MVRGHGKGDVRGSESGYSLVELLVVLVIGSLVMVLLINALMGAMGFQKREFVKQGQVDEVRFVTKLITGDLRKADEVEILDGGAGLRAGTKEYALVDGRLERNGVAVSEDIAELTFTLDERMLTIALATVENERQQQALTTKILIREGVPIVQGP